MRTSTFALAITSALGLLGCGPRIVTIKLPDADSTTDYVVCDARGTNCRGRKAEDVPPTAYSPKLDVLVPLNGSNGACPHGVRTIEIVVKKNRVTVVGYECAARELPSPLPEEPVEETPSEAGPGPLTGGLPDEPPPPMAESL